MHCKACDKELDDDEAVRRDPENPGEFLDICDECLYFHSDDDIDWEIIADVFDAEDYL